jgi:phosphoribosyl-AMP cyclohydrolase
MEFPPRGTLMEIEEGSRFMPLFDPAGLIPCITQDWQTHEVLMLGWMNREALALTMQTGLAHTTRAPGRGSGRKASNRARRRS